MYKPSDWLTWSLAAPKRLIVLVVVTSILCAFGAKNLYFRSDYKVYFETDNPQRLAFEEMQNVFNKSENVSFLIVPDNQSVFTPASFSLIYELTEAAWQIPLSTRVESLANFQHTYAEDDDMVVVDLIDTADYTQAQVDQVRSVALNTPEIANRLVARNQQAAVVNAVVQLPEGDQTSAVIAIAEFARTLKRDFEAQYPNHKIYLTGLVMLNDAFAVAARSDGETLIPAMFILIALSIALLSRSLFASFATMLIAILSSVTVVGVAGWLGLFLSTATVNVPIVITIMAVANCIHIYVGVKHFAEHNSSQQRAIASSVGLNLRPIFITRITTAIGFLMLNFSAVPVLAELGNMAAGGIMLACVLSITLFPALLVLGPSITPYVSVSQGGVFNQFGQWINRHHRLILPVSLLILAIPAAFSFNNRLNDIAVEYFDFSNPFRVAIENQKTSMGGMANIDFVIYTDKSYGITEPDVLADMEQFVTWLRQQKEVQHVLSFTDTVKRLSMNMHNDDDAYYRLPGDKERASQYTLLYEMSLPFGLDLNNQMDIDKSALKIVATLENLGSNELTEFEQRARDAFTAINPDLRLTAASPPLMFAHIGERNMKSMVWGTLLALVLISGLITFALKSWRLGLVSLMTNLLPAAVGFGVWSWLSGEINMALSVVLSMTMGIIVDDTVHFLSKYQDARKTGKAVNSSVTYSLKTVGGALATTTLVLCVGFGVLSTSSFQLNAEMGLLTLIIIIAALIIDLVFLPAFLLWFDRDADLKGEMK